MNRRDEYRSMLDTASELGLVGWLAVAGAVAAFFCVGLVPC